MKIKLNKIFPFLDWFPMSKDDLYADFIAGITVAMLLVPQSMAYAELAGLKAYYGLYAAFLPVILGALFGCCRQLGTGPVVMTSILSATVIVKVCKANPGLEYTDVAIFLCFLVGIVRLLLGIFKMAAIVNFLSYPVISGFSCAAAIIIAMSQVNKVFGLHIDNSQEFLGTVKGVYGMCLRIKDTHLSALLLAVGAMITIYIVKKYRPKWPSMLFAVILGIVISKMIKFGMPVEAGGLGGNIVGEIPKGLPPFRLPFAGWTLKETLLLAKSMFPDVCMVTIIGFLEIVSISKVISLKTKQQLDFNQELIGQGVAAIGGSFFSSYPTSTSLSRSAMNLMVGAKSGLSSVFTGIIVMFILLFFTPVLYHLPKSVLSAGIIMAVLKLVDFSPVVRAWKANKLDGAVAIITFAATLCWAPQIVKGILIGAVLSIVFYLYRTMRPNMAVLGPHDDGTLRDSKVHNLETFDEYIALRMDGSLFFASAECFENAVLKAVQQNPEAKYVILCADGINRIDASGEWAISQLLERVQDSGVQLLISGLKSSPMEVVKQTGLDKEVGEEHFFRTSEEAIAFIKSQKAAPTA